LLRRNPEKRGSHQQRGGSLKSRIIEYDKGREKEKTKTEMSENRKETKIKEKYRE
jgi:hypothetical protein